MTSRQLPPARAEMVNGDAVAMPCSQMQGYKEIGPGNSITAQNVFSPNTWRIAERKLG